MVARLKYLKQVPSDALRIAMIAFEMFNFGRKPLGVGQSSPNALDTR